jgi:hypothetical protein
MRPTTRQLLAVLIGELTKIQMETSRPDLSADEEMVCRRRAAGQLEVYLARLEEKN